VKFEWVKGKERTLEIYCNDANASWTLYDVRVVLGQLVPRDNGENAGFVVEERGAVTVARPEAKVRRDALIDLIARYEKTNGEIVRLKFPPVSP
jgi:hypothetical protein